MLEKKGIIRMNSGMYAFSISKRYPSLPEVAQDWANPILEEIFL